MIEISQEGYLDMLQELLDIDHGLSPWEIEFLESLDEWDGDFTGKQQEKLEELYRIHC